MSFTKSLFNCITFLLVMFLCVELKADENKNSYIRFSTEGTGSAHLSEIGKETVSSWKKVYANWKPAPNVKIEDLGF